MGVTEHAAVSVFARAWNGVRLKGFSKLNNARKLLTEFVVRKSESRSKFGIETEIEPYIPEKRLICKNRVTNLRFGKNDKTEANESLSIAH